jgi:putative addiction module CopG family antidote
MAVTITSETEARIQRLIDSGHYRDADAVIGDALEALETRNQRKLDELRELVLTGVNSGPGKELTDELWDDIVKRSEERYLRGETPSPHVRP